MLYHILYYMLYYYVLYKRYIVRALYALLNVTLCVILYVVHVYYIIGDARLYHMLYHNLQSCAIAYVVLWNKNS